MEMKDLFTRYTNDVIATAAFGVGVNSLMEPSNEFYLTGKDITIFGVRQLVIFGYILCYNLIKVSAWLILVV
jgi:cytochrome P450 family 9